MAAKAKPNGVASSRTGMAPLASLREPAYPTERAAKSAKKTATIAPLAIDGNFQTLKMKTNLSQWTPVLHKPANEQFDVWTDAQRKRFLQYILMRCRRTQLLYLYKWFEGRVPLEHLDFTAVLPRFLSLYILSYLDPRSLSKAAMVCWHWKFLAEQDILWMPKCIKLGWFLPYKPKDNEYGAWKRHYIHCLRTLDVAQSPKDFGLYGRMGDGSSLDDAAANRKKKQQDSDVVMMGKLDSRPVWLDPDPRPQDLENAWQSMVHYGNPNQPGLPPSTLKHSAGKTALPQSPRKHGRSWTEPARAFDYGLGAKARKDQHRTQGLDDLDLPEASTEAVTLSASIALELGQPVGSALLQSIKHESNKPVSRRRDLSAGGDYPGGIATHSQHAQGKTGVAGPTRNPRLLVISSQITAMQLLMSAVKPDVLVVAYEYIGTTLESLLFKIETSLAGSQARSIGIMVAGCDEIQLVGSMATSTASLEKPELKHFWEKLCANILPGAQGGHLDLFVPLAACDEGCVLLQQLTRLTGVAITSPSTLSDSNYGHVTGEWDNWGKSPSPASLYLEHDKLEGWLASSLRVLEAVEACQRNLRSYLREEKEDLVTKLTGDVIFKDLGILDKRLNQIAPSLVRALSNLTSQSLEVDSLAFVGNQLLKASGQSVPTAPAAKESPAKTLAKKPSPKKMSSLDLDDDSEFSEDIPEVSDFDSEVETINRNALYSSVSELRPAEAPATALTAGPQQMKEFKVTQLQSGDSRFSTAFQILTSEVAYTKQLNIIEDVYRRPLLAALKSNKAIIGQANIQMIFTDVGLILAITRELTEDLSQHLEQWCPEQCIGDCFIKLQAKLKAYTNFHKNYQIVLSTLDKCRQQFPSFRAFLKRTDRSPATGMLSLTELLLLPARRIGDYIQMLLAQQGVTADEHPDNQDLGVAVTMFRQLQTVVDECRERSERERQLQELQQRIRKCPSLLEANRFLLREQVVANMQPVDQAGQSGLYEHVQDLGLFLFNDALMVTVRTIKSLPYTRQTEALYHFHSSVALPRLLVRELPDSKYMSCAFVLQTPKRRWICAMDDESDKIDLMSAIEAAVRSSLDET